MKQVNVHGPGDFRIDEVLEPSVGAKDVVVAVRACGICGSDLGYVAAGGLMGPSDRPMPLGHELAGVVHAVGKSVKDVAIGDRVVVNPMAAGNMIGNGGTEGGFAPFLLVRNAVLGDALYRIPDSLPFDLAALVEPLGVAMHAVNQGDPGPDAKVVVMGVGPIGLGAIVALRNRGVDNIIAVDVSDERLERALLLGAGATRNVGDGDFFDFVKAEHGSWDLYGEPVLDSDLFIDATGAPQPVADVIRFAKYGATLVIVGLHKVDVPVSFRNILARELTIKGSIGYPKEFGDVIAMLTSGAVDVTPMISHRYDFSEFDDAFATARQADRAAKVMVTMGPV